MKSLENSLTSPNQKILLIEDNYDFVELLEFNLDPLKQLGATFEHCDCLADGLERIKKGDIDVVILDLSLPDSIGIKSVTRIRQSAPSIPLIVLTGTDDRELAIEILGSGAQDYLMKDTIDLSSLCHSINYASARAKVAEASAQLAAIVESSDDAIIGKTLAGTITTWNRGAEELFGYLANEAKGQSVSMLSPQENPEELSVILDSLRNGISIHNQETVRVKKSGERVDVSLTVSPIKMEDGTVTGSASIARDISEQKSTEKSLKEMEQRLSLALKAAEVGVWDLDLITGQVWRSLRHDEIFGHNILLNEWNFNIFLTYVLEDDRQIAQEVFRRGIDSGNFRMECRIVRLDKKVRWISARGETFQDKTGKPIRMMGTVVDITELKEQEEQDRLLAIMREREDFIATLTHDMKNPLIGVRRLFELFSEGRLGSLSREQVDLFESMNACVSGVLNLIRNLESIHRFETDVYSLTLVETDLVSLINSIVHRMAPIAKAQRITFKTELPNDTEIVKVDAQGIERILLNLVDNAVKFSPSDAEITLRLVPNEQCVVVDVIDRGPGIKPEEQELLFKRYSQCDVGKRYNGGSGLGLYLCKKIIEAHDGTIECVSQANKATIFRVSIPRKEQIGIQGNPEK